MPNTHLGQDISNHVTVNGRGFRDPDGFLKMSYTRVFPNGTTEPFTIPRGRVFVVTDVDWTFWDYREPNEMQTLYIAHRIMKPEYEEIPIFQSTTLGDKYGRGGASTSMTSGFIVSNMSYLRIELTHDLNIIILRGYLIDFPEARRIKVKARKQIK